MSNRQHETTIDPPSELKYTVLTPVNTALAVLFCALLFLIYRRRISPVKPTQSASLLPSLKKRDFTLETLRKFDGVKSEHILFACNGFVFDVSNATAFYGPGGPYGDLAGKDASRALGTLSLSSDVIKEEYDDLSDLSKGDRDNIKDWELQFREKYEIVGKLLKPGEVAASYSSAGEDSDSLEVRGNKDEHSSI